MIRSWAPTKYISRIFDIRDLRLGHFRDLPILTRALMGLWNFHHLLWGGVFEHPRLSGLLRIVEQNGKRRSKAREKSFRNTFGHFLSQVKIEVTRGQKI